MSTYEYAKNFIDPSYKLFIGGEWVDAIDGGTFDVFCPSNGEKLATCANANEKDVDRAVQAAEKARPDWSKTTPMERAGYLNKIGQLIDETHEKFDWTDSMEAGKAYVPFLTCNGDDFRYFAAAILSEEGTSNSLHAHHQNIVTNEPFGVVGQISPWNAPWAMTTMKMPPALAAGNCVIYRPSSYTPIGTLMMAQLMGEILPPGVLNVLTGDSATCGQAILDHPGIHKISFTGSTETGIQVAASSAKKIIPATLELGGKSADIFFDDIYDLGVAMQGLFASIFTMNGQICCGGSRVLVQESFYDRFLNAAIGLCKSIKIGPVWEDGVMVGPMINEKQVKRVLNYIEIGQKEGAKLACGGKRIIGGVYDKGWYMEPTILEGTNDMRIAREEIFGPVATFIKFKDEADAIKIANDSDYGLGGGVWTRDLNKALRVARAVHTGTMWVNTYNLVHYGYPFGGFKKSGLGREMNKATLGQFSQKKSIIINMDETRLF
jgi:acyl-CoA reductase-like NAD-dependent aldehyde dehydrogenase